MERFLRGCGWGLFCASSWTWCIGTFLPFLMLRLHGWPGFWLFLIPNVIGCTLFGWWFTPESSRRFCARHQPLLATFSAVTIAFQGAFLAWILPGAASLVDEPGCATASQLMGALALGLGTMAALWAWWRRDGVWLVVAGIATLGSIAILWCTPVTPLEQWPAEGTLPRRDLLLAAPLIIAGFLCCPCLDLTFHRARQSVDAPWPFAVFGLTFGLTIVGVALQWDGTAADPGFAMLSVWCVQLPFTALAHLRELAGALHTGGLDARRAMDGLRLEVIARPLRGLAMPLVLVAAVAGLGLVAQAFLPDSPFAWYFPGETGYLRWLAMYGVVFPIAVLASLAHWRRASGVLAVAVAAVAAELGFLQADAWWLLLACAIVAVVAISWQRRAAWPERA